MGTGQRVPWPSYRQTPPCTPSLHSLLTAISTELLVFYRDPRSAPRDSRPRVTWSTETRGVGLGYNFPERNNPDISNHERNFREAFNGMQKKQKQSFVQSLYFQKYKSFETDNAPGGGPKLVTKIH